jgi:hypothetical protein
MTERVSLNRVYIWPFLVFLGGLIGAFFLWGSWDACMGLIFGFALGLLPFLSWHWLAGFLHRPRGVRVILIVTVLKYCFIGGAIFYVISYNILNPLGIFAGMLMAILPIVLCSIGYLSRRIQFEDPPRS